MTASKGEEGLLEIVSFLGNFYNLQEPEERLFVLKGAMIAGYPELAIVLRRLFVSEEPSAADQALNRE